MSTAANTADFDTVLNGAVGPIPSSRSYELSLFHNGDRGQCDWAYEAFCDQAEGILEELEPHRVNGREIDLDTLLLDKALQTAAFDRLWVDLANNTDRSYELGGSKYNPTAWF